MVFALVTIISVIVFVAAAFALRMRMSELNALYETRTKTLQMADAAWELLDGALVERELDEAVENVAVMQRNRVLFRTLWPSEYDATFFNAQRFIAQSNSALLTSASR